MTAAVRPPAVRRARAGLLIATAACALAAAAAGPSWPQQATTQRQAVLRERETAAERAAAQEAAAQAAAEEAERLERERAQLAEDLATLGQSIVARERSLEAARAEIVRLRREMGDARNRLDASRGRLQRLLARALRAAREPTPSLLVSPDRPVDAARSALLMRRFAAALTEERDAHARALRDFEAAAAAAREVEAAAWTEIGAMVEDEEAVRQLLDARARASADRRAEAAAAAERAQRLAQEAESLNALARSLESPAPQSPQTSAPFAEARGRLLRPAVGDLVASTSRSDPRATILTRPLARVIAPWGGAVLLAQTIAPYGDVVMIEPAPGYSIILSGLASVSVRPGDTVVAGQPIGRMGGPPPASGGEFMFEWTGEAENARERLYLEIIRNGAPVNPAPWLRPERDG